ncbi:PorP/SprF family type IX secretion system membrane protein [Croceitalea marina]|uniref:PorP/SprF family type IX secretion system membrane protein n=1 Tax=Croceitalea marina TaxID=1775166 RepID=A0ABW5MXC9_9FLAO
MRKNIVAFFLILFSCGLFGQEAVLPADFRQHALTQFNSSLLSATYALDWNNPRAISLWTRWQWQTIDGDPTTTFVNYSHSFNEKTAVGLGFLQHNTGVFLNTGGLLNFAQSFRLQDNMNLIVGANIYAFSQELADENINAAPGVLGLEDINNFIAQFSPSIRLNINQFNIAAALENVLDYNFSDSQMNDDSMIFTGIISNDFSLNLFPSLPNSFVRPLAYVKSIPNYDLQYGGNVLFSTAKFWLQGGYNSFYGTSGGLGVTLFEKVSLGGLIEFGTGGEFSDADPTFEILASYQFGKPKKSQSIDELEIEEEVNKEEDDAGKKEIEAEKALEDAKTMALVEEAKRREQDSIQAARANEDLLRQERQRRQDSIAAIVAQTKKVTVLPNEKYEEVSRTNIEGLEPGFYLIANVFGTKKYFEAFMKNMTAKGLRPGSFYRSTNKFNYVYLGKYNTIQEARDARNSKMNGKYPDKLWIFRVKGN